MQLFLPYPQVEKSLNCLDNKRLFKQVVEAKQIYNIITKDLKGYANHPAIRMIRGHVNFLIYYYNAGLRLVKRKLKYKVKSLLFLPYKLNYGFSEPLWLGYPKFHDSHKSALLFKKPSWYTQFGWQVEAVKNYVWPVGKNGLLEEIKAWKFSLLSKGVL